MSQLRFVSLAYPESKLRAWSRGEYGLLRALPPGSFVKRILREKLRNRSRAGRRFFGEAFVVKHEEPEDAWYGSFRWLDSWPAKSTSPFGDEYRKALGRYFPAIQRLSQRAMVLRDCLGKRPTQPDLWLVSRGEHRFVEVKLPRDRVSDTQIAGLALIAACLSKQHNVSVAIYNLYPEGAVPDAIPESVTERFQEFYRLLKR